MTTRWPRNVILGDFLADNDSDSDFRVTVRMTGWDDAAPINLSIDPHMQSDGGWDSTGFYGPRVIGIEGEVVQPSHAEAQAVRDQLMTLSPHSPQTLTVTSAGLESARSASVRISKGAVIEWVGPVRFRYSLEVVAPDPLKYGPATFGQTTLAASSGGTGRVWPRVWPRDWGVPPGVIPGAVALSNAGTASYFPRLRIDGAVTNPVVTLVETGDQVRFNGTVAAGQWLDFGLARRRVLLNGVVSQRNLVSFVGSWLAVPVGGGSVSWSADSYDDAHKLSVFGYEGAWA